jgi:opacity protein-like surface antigen
LVNLSAQKTSFGVQAGYLNGTAKAESSFEGVKLSFSESEPGFYIGGLAEYKISKKLAIQPSLLYGNIPSSIIYGSEESELSEEENESDLNILFIPIIVKYYLADSFYGQSGFQGTLFLKEKEEETDNFGLDLSVGMGFDITKNFFIDGRYSFELTNRSSDSTEDTGGDKLTYNTFHVGLGYKF